MNRLQDAKKVFLIVNEELTKLDELNMPVVRRLKMINEELSEAVIDLIKKYESLCISSATSARQGQASDTSTSEKQGAGHQRLSGSRAR